MALSNEPGNLSISSSHRGLAPPAGVVYQSDTGTPQNVFVPVAPAPQTQPTRDPKRQRVMGLVGAVAGSVHPLIEREKPRVRVDPREVSKLRAALRRADADRLAAESAWAATCTGTDAGGDKDKLAAARRSVDIAAALRGRLAEMESTAASRPIRVSTVTVREPGEVPEALSSGETFVVCLHDGCKSHRWASEDEMRRAHPTHTDMVRAQQTHVWAFLSEAALDPLDPDGEKVGYIAPVGRDGTTIARAVADAQDEPGASAEEVSALRAENATLAERLAKLEQLIIDLGKGTKK